VTSLVEIAVFTDDVAEARAFYEALVGAPPVAEWAGGAIFAVGDGRLLVHERAATTNDGPPNEDHFALAIVDLDGACAVLAAAGSTFLVEPRDYPWGRSAYLRDPDGRLVELTQA
jgi:catechol 2,3-dioxygenase-like lactoylglutathione lyase family enzyme